MIKRSETSGGIEIIFDKLKSFSKFKGSKRIPGYEAVCYLTPDDISLFADWEFIPDILMYSDSAQLVLDDDKEARQAMYNIEKEIVRRSNILVKESPKDDVPDLIVASIFNVVIMVGEKNIKWSVMFSIEGHKKNEQ